MKVRDGLLDVKGLLAVDDDGLEQWVPVAKHPFPVSRDDVAAALARLQRGARRRSTARPTPPSELLDEVVPPIDALRAVMAHKRRTHYRVGGCMAEICELRTDEGSTRSLAIESEDPARVMAAVRSLGLEARANVCMVRGLKVLTSFGLVRYAVIDVGTNSVKLHVGERRADDTWSVVVDRAIVTRLGEGLDATGALEPEPMDRTLEAIAALADEARAAGAAAIAAVGTAGLRAATNAAEFVERRRGSLRRPDRDHPRRGGGPPRLPRGHDGPRPAPRLARGLRHRRGQLAVHLRRRGRGRGAVQRARRRGPPDGALRARPRRVRRGPPRRARR